MPKLKFFASCKTKQAAKKEFRTLAKLHHPDIFQTEAEKEAANETMKAIISEYELIIKKLPSEQTESAPNADETEQQYNERISAEMQDIINSISHLPIDIEIVGSWIWVSGNTYPYKAYLTANNFTWCAKKKMYSWHAGEKYKRYGKTKDIEDIRSTYGSQRVINKQMASIAG